MPAFFEMSDGDFTRRLIYRSTRAAFGFDGLGFVARSGRWRRERVLWSDRDGCVEEARVDLGGVFHLEDFLFVEECERCAEKNFPCFIFRENTQI